MNKADTDMRIETATKSLTMDLSILRERDPTLRAGSAIKHPGKASNYQGGSPTISFLPGLHGFARSQRDDASEAACHRARAAENRF